MQCVCFTEPKDESNGKMQSSCRRVYLFPFGCQNKKDWALGLPIQESGSSCFIHFKLLPAQSSYLVSFFILLGRERRIQWGLHLRRRHNRLWGLARLHDLLDQDSWPQAESHLSRPWSCDSRTVKKLILRLATKASSQNSSLRAAPCQSFWSLHELMQKKEDVVFYYKSQVLVG